MAFLQSLKSQLNSVNLSISELAKDVSYPVRTMKNVDTKFGTSVSCVLIDVANTQTINIFLPKAIKMTDEEISEYNLGSVPGVSLIYRGLNKRSFIIDFE
ncbi:unnamed protein product [Macrosiphum euphorbiae]|uniref:Uncharacterized protein n=1 Tax=Macrosiphum euphorbiae TaxID=13131 RepID=A0AAV0Y4R1_9HEMI|nr:unnamed protein product [Macrosiphum euphorbiae]